MSGFKYEIQAALCTWGPRCLKIHASSLLCPKKSKIVNVHCILGHLGFLPVEAEGMRRDILLNLSQWHRFFIYIFFLHLSHISDVQILSFQTEVWLKRCACIGQTQTNVNSFFFFFSLTWINKLISLLWMCGKGFYLAATYSFDLVETVHEQQGGVRINEADFTKKEIALGELRVILHAMCHKCMQCPKLFFSPTTVQRQIIPGSFMWYCWHWLHIHAYNYYLFFYYIVGILLVLLAKKQQVNWSKTCRS